MSVTIQVGDLVEFTDQEPRGSYTLGDPRLARYGVATEAERPDGSCTVMLHDRKTRLVPGGCIHAYAFHWAGDVEEQPEMKALMDLQDELDPSGDWEGY